MKQLPRSVFLCSSLTVASCLLQRGRRALQASSFPIRPFFDTSPRSSLRPATFSFPNGLLSATLDSTLKGL